MWLMSIFAVVVFISLLFYATGLRVITSCVLIDADSNAIILEYPEIEMTTDDKDWIGTIIRHEKTQNAFLSDSGSAVQFNLSDTDLECFSQFPENDCLISVDAGGIASGFVSISFNPIVKNGEILDFGFAVSFDEHCRPKYTKTLNVYKFDGEIDMTFENLLARYYNFEGSLRAEVPGSTLVWGDMTILRFIHPRAEVFSQ